jgi:hypothetical protein
MRVFAYATTAGARVREAAHKKAKISSISHLTEQNHAPIYAAHAASETTVLRAATLLWQDENSRQVELFDIVIRGRGTWATARSPTPEQSGGLRNQAIRLSSFGSRSSKSNMESRIPASQGAGVRPRHE